MSLVGERSRSSLRQRSAGEQTRGQSPDVSLDALPLRLSVARQTLGIELSHPIQGGPFSIEELNLGLVGLQYPVDLSKGVKQFRNRRTRLERLVVRIDFSRWAEGASHWSQDLLPGEFLGLRVIPHCFVGALGQEISSEPFLSFTLHSTESVLSFDWVPVSGQSSRWVVDAARGVGLSEPPLALALRWVDRWMAELQAALGARLRREGRAIELKDLARLLCLWILPEWGCRMPELGPELALRVEFVRGELFLILDGASDAVAVGRRGLQLSGLADLTRAADESLTQGDFRAARALYLDALERAPRHPDLLSGLAALDLWSSGRAEASLSFIEEAPAFEDWPVPAWGYQLESRALQVTGRFEAARESAAQAAALEPDGILASRLFSELAGSARTEQTKSVFLQRAVERAPQLVRPRVERLKYRIGAGDLRGALADAEHLDALAEGEEQRAELSLQIGQLFFSGGFRSEATSWLKRALRREPESFRVKYLLARVFAESGENLRAIELLQSILRAPSEQTSAQDRARLFLARLLSSDSLDLPQALATLHAIETRAELGLVARVSEGELATRLGDVHARVRAHVRLFEALELGWVEGARAAHALLQIARREREAANEELVQRALRLMELALVEAERSAGGEEPRLDDAALDDDFGQAVDIPKASEIVELRAELSRFHAIAAPLA